MRRLWVLPLVLGLSLVMATASGFWTTLSVVGGSGGAASASVSQGATPSAVVVGRAVTLTWSATTLTNGVAVSGYEIRRYTSGTLVQQSIRSACTGTIAGTSCVESRVPAGQWVYSVTPVFGANWRGPESVKSSPVTIASPTLLLQGGTVKPGASVSGAAAGFLDGETLRYRLDGPAGAELTGALAGVATPTSVPGSGGGSASITVPAGTSDGVHTIHAVATPSNDVAVAIVVVDGTPPPVPVLTGTPGSPSGRAVAFTFTEAEATATVQCRLDTAAFAACTSPTTYAGLSGGSHKFEARAVDTVGNESATVSHTWFVNTAVPSVNITFPLEGVRYNDAGFLAGCGTGSVGDVCGTAEDDFSVASSDISLRQVSTLKYWNGTSFSATNEDFQSANGRESWSYNLNPASLPEGDYVLRARARDWGLLGLFGNSSYDSHTFTIDRTAPPVPTITGRPSTFAGSSATFTFTTGEPTATFQCRLDAGSWSACPSPRTYDGLSQAGHVFDVRAVDAAGNLSAPASASWTVDLTAPTAAMAFPSAATYDATSWDAGCGTPAVGDLCGTASDVGGSGVAAVDLSIRRLDTNTYWDGSGFGTGSETWLPATGTTTWSYAFAAGGFPADGSYTVRRRVTDLAGNTATDSVTLVIATTPPAAAPDGGEPIT